VVCSVQRQWQCWTVPSRARHTTQTASLTARDALWDIIAAHSHCQVPVVSAADFIATGSRYVTLCHAPVSASAEVYRTLWLTQNIWDALGRVMIDELTTILILPLPPTLHTGASWLFWLLRLINTLTYLLTYFHRPPWNVAVYTFDITSTNLNQF